MSNEEIVALIRQDQTNKQELIYSLYDQNFSLIKIISLKYAYKFNIELDDVMQTAYIALYKAVDKYDESKGMPFMSFFGYALLNELRTYNCTISIPSNIRIQIRKMNRVINEYSASYGVEPDKKYIASEMNVSLDVVEKLYSINNLMNMASLDKEYTNSDSTYTLADVIPDSEDMLDDKYAESDELEHLRNDLQECLNLLEYEPKTIIEAYYLKDNDTAVIAQKMGITEDDVRAYKSKGMRELRKNRKKLMQYYDRISAGLYAGTGIGNFRRTETSVTERVAFMLLESENRKSDTKRNIIQQYNMMDVCAEG